MQKTDEKRVIVVYGPGPAGRPVKHVPLQHDTHESWDGSTVVRDFYRDGLGVPHPRAARWQLVLLKGWFLLFHRLLHCESVSGQDWICLSLDEGWKCEGDEYLLQRIIFFLGCRFVIFRFHIF
jgi:hypothetical protein